MRIEHPDSPGVLELTGDDLISYLMIRFNMSKEEAVKSSSDNSDGSFFIMKGELIALELEELFAIPEYADVNENKEKT